MKATCALALLAVLAGCAGQPETRLLVEPCSAAGTLADGTASVAALRIDRFVDPRTRVVVVRLFGTDAADRSHAFQAHLTLALEGTGRAPRDLDVGPRDFATEGEAGPYCDLRFTRSNFPGGGVYIAKVEARLPDGRALAVNSTFQYQAVQ